jgi:hypothetical protein
MPISYYRTLSLFGYVHFPLLEDYTHLLDFLYV